MEDKKKLGLLDSMTKESFSSRPNQAPDAITEYLENLETENTILVDNLKFKLENTEYNKKFKVAITQTSLMVFIALYKATQPEEENIRWDKYMAEYLLYAKDDDSDIYNMRMYYLNSLNSEEMNIGEEPDDLNDEEESETSVEKELMQNEIIKQRKEYDIMINTVKEKYTSRNSYLVS